MEGHSSNKREYEQLQIKQKGQEPIFGISSNLFFSHCCVVFTHSCFLNLSTWGKWVRQSLLFKGGVRSLVSGCLPAPFASYMVDLTMGPAVENKSPEPSSLPHEGKYLPLWEKAPAERKDFRPANLITLSWTCHCPLCLYSISGLTAKWFSHNSPPCSGGENRYLWHLVHPSADG